MIKPSGKFCVLNIDLIAVGDRVLANSVLDNSPLMYSLTVGRIMSWIMITTLKIPSIDSASFARVFMNEIDDNMACSVKKYVIRNGTEIANVYKYVLSLMQKMSYSRTCCALGSNHDTALTGMVSSISIDSTISSNKACRESNVFVNEVAWYNLRRWLVNWSSRAAAAAGVSARARDSKHLLATTL